MTDDASSRPGGSGPPPGYRVAAGDTATQLRQLFELAAGEEAAPAGSVPLTAAGSTAPAASAAAAAAAAPPWSVDEVLAAGRDQERQEWKDRTHRADRRGRVLGWTGVAALVAAVVVVVPLVSRGASNSASTGAISSSSSADSSTSSDSSSSASGLPAAGPAGSAAAGSSSDSASSQSSEAVSSGSQSSGAMSGSALSSGAASGAAPSDALLPNGLPQEAMSSAMSSSDSDSGAPKPAPNPGLSPTTTGHPAAGGATSASGQPAPSGPCAPLPAAALAAVRTVLPAGVSSRPVPVPRCDPGISAAAGFPAAGASAGSAGAAAGLVVAVSRSAPGACRAAGCQPVDGSRPAGPSEASVGPREPYAYSGTCGSGCTQVWVYAGGREATVAASGVPRGLEQLIRVARAALTTG